MRRPHTQSDLASTVKTWLREKPPCSFNYKINGLQMRKKEEKICLNTELQVLGTWLDS